MTSRPVEEIKMRCSVVLGDEAIITIVGSGSSPTATYEMVFTKTCDTSRAKAARWLAIMRRDFHEEYEKIISAK